MRAIPFLGVLAGVRDRAADVAGMRYSVSVAHAWETVEARWEAMAQRGASLPFQRRSWLSSWYATLGRAPGSEPLLVTIRDENLDRDVMALPLVRFQRGKLRVVGFADGGLTDYNAPIVAPGAPATIGAAMAMMAVLRRAVAPADIIEFEKMPSEIGGRANPLALLDVRESRLHGNMLHVPGAWDEWHWGLERTFRKELERSWRVFTKHEGAEFRRIEDMDEARRIFAALKDMQGARIRECGLPYVLDEPLNDAFYDGVLERGLANGSAILTALTVKGEVVAALFGVAQGDHYAMVRLAAAGAQWKNCSPGRLVIERTMRLLHGEGFRWFDFTIGDYAYKRRLGVTQSTLREMRAAMSWRGLPTIARDSARRTLRNDPLAAALIQGARDWKAKLTRSRDGSAAKP